MKYKLDHSTPIQNGREVPRKPFFPPAPLPLLFHFSLLSCRDFPVFVVVCVGGKKKTRGGPTKRKLRGGAFFKPVLTLRKHQTLCLVLQLQAASSRAASTDRLHGYPTGYYYERNASSVAPRLPEPRWLVVPPHPQPGRKSLSGGRVYCWTSRDFFAVHLVIVYCVYRYLLT